MKSSQSRPEDERPSAEIELKVKVPAKSFEAMVKTYSTGRTKRRDRKLVRQAVSDVFKSIIGIFWK
jgi:hypothetical protein